MPLLESRIAAGPNGNLVTKNSKYDFFVEYTTGAQKAGKLSYVTYSGVKWTAKTIRNW